jgi:hypothetical protein
MARVRKGFQRVVVVLTEDVASEIHRLSTVNRQFLSGWLDVYLRKSLGLPAHSLHPSNLGAAAPDPATVDPLPEMTEEEFEAAERVRAAADEAEYIARKSLELGFDKLFSRPDEVDHD